jgi:superfamily II DNA or RNA helicase
MAQLPTGGGKTRTAAELITLAAAKAAGAFPVVFTVPRIGLVNQTVRAFWEEGLKDIGVIQASRRTRRSAMVQVASLQTLPNRSIPPARLVIVDEAHIRSDWLWAQMAPGGAWANVPIIGLSATPWTRGLGQHFDDLVSVVTMAELIEAGALSKYRLRWPGKRPDLSAVQTNRGLDGEMDYNAAQLAEVMSAPSLVADAVQTWLEQGEGRPTVCFGVDRAHAQSLCEQFQAAGVPAEYADAHAETDERDAIGDRLRTGATKVFVNVGIATTGIDWPWVSCLSMCRPTQSPMLWVQIAGRVLRKHPQGGDSIILDHTDTSKNLGGRKTSTTSRLTADRRTRAARASAKSATRRRRGNAFRART